MFVVEEAAIASARTMGQGDREGSDQAAVQAMRKAFEDVQIAGEIVIGEGERDEAPMLYIGEKVGAAARPGIEYPQVDIAVDPSKAPTSARSALRIRLLFSPPPSPADCCTRPIATWRRSSPAPRAAMRWISTRR